MLVAMFRNTPTGPVQLDYPFAHEVEDVENSNGVWVRAVRLYVSILSSPTRKGRLEALETAEKSLISRRDDPGSAAIARDIRSYLARNGRAVRPMPMAPHG